MMNDAEARSELSRVLHHMRGAEAVAAAQALLSSHPVIASLSHSHSATLPLHEAVHGNGDMVAELVALLLQAYPEATQWPGSTAALRRLLSRRSAGRAPGHGVSRGHHSEHWRLAAAAHGC